MIKQHDTCNRSDTGGIYTDAALLDGSNGRVLQQVNPHNSGDYLSALAGPLPKFYKPLWPGVEDWHGVIVNNLATNAVVEGAVAGLFMIALMTRRWNVFGAGDWPRPSGIYHRRTSNDGGQQTRTASP